MTIKITDVTEEYLECIYRLQQKRGVARTSEIVKMLQVAPGTVTNTIERLERGGLILHEPYKGVTLTDEGGKIAIDVLRRHRLSERLLTDLLQVERDEAHKAACKLEHGLTEHVVAHLEKALGYPKTCPHGNPIPTKRGIIIEEQMILLTNLNEKEKGVVVKIELEDPKILRFLYTLNLIPDTNIEIVETAPFDKPITIKSNGKLQKVRYDIASKIWIKKF
ncbi:MAG: metal-dependent transcriptional regulator [Candidatus Bathyarchaeota archaeon]|nr:MAG: metal-dependent transcriptional regulator [Candidatus Bathyarchaeota archaeon]